MEILKKNEINKKGILIEYDAGYISPRDNKHFINEINKLTRGESIVEEPLVVYAVMQKYGVENKNGRIYPENILRKEAENYLKLIKEKRAMGEADHPESSIVAISRISHNVTELWWEGNVRKGLKIGVSSRGVGSLQKENGKNIVQDDFELICWDVVTSPSTPGSWIYNEEPSREQQMSESKENKDKKLLMDDLNNFLSD